MGARGLLLVTLVHGIAAPARHRLRPLAAVRMSSSSSPPPPRPPPPPPSLPPSFTVPADATVREALATAETTLQACGDPEAGAAARHLVACAVGETGPQSLSNLQARVVASGHADDVLGAEAAAQLAELMRRRSAREPIQYLIGEWDFHMLTLKVRPPILVPRPETEELVEYILAELRTEGERLGLGLGTTTPIRILDIGAGSGAIGLALVAALPGVTCVGIDPNMEAVVLASENAAMLGLEGRYECVHASLEEFVSRGGDGDVGGSGGKGATSTAPAFDLVVSNPPYIPRPDMAALEPEVRVYEDDAALCGGTDGLDIVRQILDAAPGLLGRDGRGERGEGGQGGAGLARWRLESAVWLEVDSSHPPLVAELVGSGAVSGDEGAMGLRMVRAIDDLGGLPRFCVLGLGA